MAGTRRREQQQGVGHGQGDLVPFGTRTRDGRTTQLGFPTGYGPDSWIWVDIGVCFFWAFCCFPCCWDRVIVPHTTLLLRSHMLLLPLPPSAFPGRCFFLGGHLQSTKQCGDHQALYVLRQFDLDIWLTTLPAGYSSAAFSMLMELMSWCISIRHPPGKSAQLGKVRNSFIAIICSIWSSTADSCSIADKNLAVIFEKWGVLGSWQCCTAFFLSVQKWWKFS